MTSYLLGMFLTIGYRNSNRFTKKEQN